MESERPSLADVVRQHCMVPHPEGGFYRETYRAEQTLPGTGRSVCTAIYYALGAGEHSRLHRIDADELWHFYGGDPLLVVELVAGARPRVTRLSSEAPQHLVCAGTWFGAMPADGSEYCLVGCTVSPGFEFAHFELGAQRDLLNVFPEAREFIERLAR